MLKWIALVIVVVIAAGLLYVRLAPTDPADWHTASDADTAGDTTTINSHHSVRPFTTGPEDMLRAVDLTAGDWPRTRAIAGSIEEGMITYETRSQLMGYPDYTTVSIIPAAANHPAFLSIHARSRFGKGDMGVNKARAEAWLDRLGPLVMPAS
jgi:uncharacterized protein (DUF1499 family)